jgi:hypothetical protein
MLPARSNRPRYAVGLEGSRRLAWFSGSVGALRQLGVVLITAFR